MLRAVVFDFDGLILDTESTELAGWKEIYREHGCELTHEMWKDAVGRPNSHFEPCEGLEKLIGRGVDRAGMWERKRGIVREMNLKLAAREGVREWLEEAKRLGVKVGLASSSNHDWVEGHLGRVGLLDFFGCLTCFEDTETHKPEPGPYVEALRRLGVGAREAVALEDSEHGLRAAKGAGMWCLAVPNEVTSGMDFSRADWVVRSLREISLGEVAGRIQNAEFRIQSGGRESAS